MLSPGRSTGKSIFNGCPDCLVFPRRNSYHYHTSLVFNALATDINSLSPLNAFLKTLSKERKERKKWKIGSRIT